MYALKNIYQDLKHNIDNMPSSCVDITMPDVLSRLIVDDKGNIPIVEYLNQEHINNDLRSGLLLHDLSGIGLYILGPLLAEQWSEDKLFRSFKAVLLLPIERRQLFEIKTTPQSIEDFFMIWGVTPNPLPAPEEILIIVSGHSGSKLRSNTKEEDKPAEIELQKKWLELINQLNLSYIIVSNENANLTLNPQKEFCVTLRPFDFGVKHLAGRTHETAYTLEGHTILAEAKAAIEQTLFQEKISGSILTTLEWHQEVFDFRRLQDMNQLRIKIPYIYPAINPFFMLKRIAKILGCNVESESVSTINENKNIIDMTPDALSAPEHWFCAAMTHQKGSNEYSCYAAGNFLIARKLSDNYIAVIPETSTQSMNVQQSSAAHEINDINDIVEILQITLNGTMPDNSSTKQVMEALQASKDNFCKNKKRKLNDQSYAIFKILENLLKENNPNDMYKKHFSRENKKQIAYATLQEKVTSGILQIQPPASTTQMVRSILSGKSNGDFISSPLVTAISATYIPEVNRYPLSFLAMQCLLDLIENQIDNEKHYWESMFAHPAYNHPANTLIDAMYTDIAHVMGGYQVMSHANSFHQTNPNDTQPRFGVHWVDFKTNIILIKWLSLSLEREQNLNPHLSGFLLPAPFQDKPIYKSSYYDILVNRVGCASTYLFDRLSRRLLTFNYMLSPQDPLRKSCPTNQLAFDEWAKNQTYAANARFCYPTANAKIPQVMCSTPFAELCHAVLGNQSPLLDKSVYFRVGESPIFMQSSSDEFPENAERLDEKEVREVLFNNILMMDPDFYQCYLLKADFIFFHYGDLLLTFDLINHVRSFNPTAHPYAHEASTLIKVYGFLAIHLLSKRIESNSFRPDLFFLRAFVNNELSKPTEIIMEDLVVFLNKTQDLPTEQNEYYFKAIELLEKCKAKQSASCSSISHSQPDITTTPTRTEQPAPLPAYRQFLKNHRMIISGVIIGTAAVCYGLLQQSKNGFKK